MARTPLLYLVKKVVLQNYGQVCNKARYLSIITADKPISNLTWTGTKFYT